MAVGGSEAGVALGGWSIQTKRGLEYHVDSDANGDRKITLMIDLTPARAMTGPQSCWTWSRAAPGQFSTDRENAAA